jgi:hypothetical protein
MATLTRKQAARKAQRNPCAVTWRKIEKFLKEAKP